MCYAINKPIHVLPSQVWLAGSLVALLGCAHAMQQPLTDQERHEFSDIAAFNQRHIIGGYLLKDRLVKDLNLSGLRLDRADIQNVHYEALDFSSALIVNSKFEETDFRGCTLSNASFERVQFNKCDLSGVRATKARFDRCTFFQCRVTDADFSEATFVNCTFDQLAGESMRFVGAKLRDMVFRNSQLLKFKFFKAELQSLVLSSCQTTETTFSRIQGSSLRIEGGALMESGCDNTTLEDLSLEGTSVTNVTLSYVQLARLSVVKCPSLQSLRFSDNVLEKAAFDGCPDLLQPAFYRSVIRDLVISNSNATWWRFVECQLDGESSFRSCQFHGLDFSRSQVKNLRFQDCTIMEAVLAEGSVFDSLTIRATTVAPNSEVRDAGAEYKNSDRFLAK